MLDYTLADYQRMKSVGANVQSIRIGLGSMGYGRGGVADPSYLARLQSMVNLAKVDRFTLSHALIKGRTGLNGPLRTFIIDIFTAAVRGNGG